MIKEQATTLKQARVPRVDNRGTVVDDADLTGAKFARRWGGGIISESQGDDAGKSQRVLSDGAGESILAAVTTRPAGQFVKIVTSGALCVAIGSMGGCQFKGAPPASGLAQAPTNHAGHAEAGWQPRPVRVRIYPSTRFAAENGKSLLLADVQLLDAMGDTTKAAGRLRCELFSQISGSSGQSPGRKLYRWDVNLLTLADQEKYYDPITRGYLLRLKLDNLAVAKESTVLRVMFIPASGARLVTQRDLPIGW